MTESRLGEPTAERVLEVLKEMIREKSRYLTDVGDFARLVSKDSVDSVSLEDSLSEGDPKIQETLKELLVLTELYRRAHK